MGQAKKRGTLEERVKQATDRVEAQIHEGERIFQEQWNYCWEHMNEEDRKNFIAEKELTQDDSAKLYALVIKYMERYVQQKAQ